MLKQLIELTKTYQIKVDHLTKLNDGLRDTPDWDNYDLILNRDGQIAAYNEAIGDIFEILGMGESVENKAN